MAKIKLGLTALLLLFTNIGHSQIYFQQNVNYKIDVELDDIKHVLRGYEELNYVNNSPDKLDSLWFHVWPNAYTNHTTALAKQLLNHGNTIFHFSNQEDRGYIDSLDFEINNLAVDWQFDQTHIDIVKIKLNKTLNPGDSILITTPFKVKIPSGKISRLGHIDQQYQITQWYPKPAVYDNKGWHPMPYLNMGEFYSEFGSFDVSITLPENYIVGATGDLQDAKEIFFMDSLSRKTAAQNKFRADKLDFPESSTTFKTINFTQNKVHDFAWFADKRYNVLKGSAKLPDSEKEITTWALFTNQYAKLWKNSLEYVNDALFYYSKWNGEYPYNHATAVEGALSAGAGMEYPNITIIGVAGDAKSLENVIMHEVGHNWFYGILGSNERDHPWMDEGLNTYNESRYMNIKYPANEKNKMLQFAGLNKFNAIDYDALSYQYVARENKDQAISTAAPDMGDLNYGLITYKKTGLSFHYLKQIVGDEALDTAMKAYYETWKFKHPYPEDLKASLEKSLNKNLDWFFTDIINSTKKIDYLVKRQRTRKRITEVKIKNYGKLAAPFQLSKSTFGKDAKPYEGFSGRSQWVTVEGASKKDKIWLTNYNDINYSNNTAPSKRILNFKLVGSAEQKNNYQINYTPLLGWNNYNKFMPGMAFYNISVPTKKLEYFVMPLLSTGHNTQLLSGSAKVAYRFYPSEIFREIKFSSQIKSYNSPIEPFNEVGSFINFQNGVSAEFKKQEFKSNWLHKLFATVTYIDESPIDEDQIDQSLYQLNYQNTYTTIGYNVAHKNVINDLKINLEYENHKDFSKISSELIYKYRYHENSSIETRLFIGKFLNNNSVHPKYNWRMDGQSGARDYAYNAVLMDRGQRDPLLSRQFISNHGSFKTPTSVGQSNNYIVALNLKTKIPIGLPLGLFADLGKNHSDFLYDAGIYVPLIKKFCTIYFPVIYSNNIKTEYDINGVEFSERIRFTLNLDLLDLMKLKDLIEF